MIQASPVGTDQLLNVESTLSFNFPQPSSMLIFGWEIVDFETMINQKSTSQPKINQIWSWNVNVEKWLKFGWQLVDFSLNCGWEVDFWLIIVSKSTISQPNINVDIWLRNWSVPIGSEIINQIYDEALANKHTLNWDSEKIRTCLHQTIFSNSRGYLKNYCTNRLVQWRNRRGGGAGGRVPPDIFSPGKFCGPMEKIEAKKKGEMEKKSAKSRKMEFYS